MKEIIKQLSERPIAYYPAYARLAGSITAGLLLSQLMYWFTKQDKIFKTDAEIMAETMLSKDELRSAKSKLKNLDFLTISREGIPAKTFYEIDWDLLENALNFDKKVVKNNETRQVKTPKQDVVNSQDKIREFPETGLGKFTKQDELNSQISYYNAENTTENTTENKKEKIKKEKIKAVENEIVLPKFLNPEIWSNYLIYKKERREKLTPMGIKMKFAEWEKWHNQGIDVNQCIVTAMANNWQGVFKPKPKQEYKSSNNYDNQEISQEDMKRFGFKDYSKAPDIDLDSVFNANRFLIGAVNE
ncbi:hypothetical protein CPIN17260_1095 [Campylobacter pinnipediorum subsp. pinnipediorum]|uniref:hypothetical protein n=1 Tax=Campylobacter pinnipediorum TaxID=1965231 RepID=UPI00099541C3|nr:hypothetical protein [Campylobacter pinnipediorum]AQW81384.1 hypothetical protein CPIN17260_1095 [Campylobacter pinnipediorum subsp. pinnipediorum]